MGIRANVAIANEIIMASPPALGIGTLLIRLAFGLSTAPTLKAKNLTKGVKTSEVKSVAISTRTNFKVIGII